MATLLQISKQQNVHQEVMEYIARQLSLASPANMIWNDQSAESIERDNPFLIVLDGFSYGAEIFGICRTLKSGDKTRSIPLVVLGPGEFCLWHESAIEAGADAVFWQPWDDHEMALRCKVLIRMRHYSRENRNNLANLMRMAKVTSRHLEQTLLEVRKLMEVSESMIVQLSVEGDIRRVSRKTCDILRWSEADIIGKNWFDMFVAASSRGKALEVFNQLSGAPERRDFYLEHAVLASTREERIIRCHYSSLCDIHGRVSGVVLSGQDVTVSRRIENALRDSEGRYETMAEISPVGIFRIDGNGHYHYINDRWRQITGLERHRVWETPWLDSIHADDRQRVEELWGQMQTDHKNFRVEFRFLHPDDRLVWVFCQMVPEKDPSGQIKGFLGTINDISERKHAEEMLRNYENTVESSEDMLIALDREYRFIIANHAFLRYFDLQREEVIGKKAGDILDHDIFEKSMKFNLDLCMKGKFVQYERPVNLPRTGKRFVSESIFPLTDQAGQISGIVASLRDITDRKIVEKKLFDYQQQLRLLTSRLSLSEEKERRRIAVELHDRISQTLVFAKIKVDLLKGGDMPGDINGPLGEVAGLIHQTLDEVHRLTHELSYPILYEMGLEAAISEWIDDNIRKRHKIHTQFTDDGQPKPMSDEVRLILFRAVRELLVNVVKHAQARNVLVVIRRAEPYVEIMVQDDGIGFGGGDRMGSDVSSGFGLFNIRERLDHVQGRMIIESIGGKGTKIVVRAPLEGYSIIEESYDATVMRSGDLIKGIEE